MGIDLHRRVAALVIAPLLVVSLAACEGVEPEAPPTLTPTPTPTPTETIAAPVAPTSRVPATCDAVMASDLVSGFVETKVTSSIDPLQALVDQAGFLDCIIRDGTLGGTPALLAVAVAVGQPAGALSEAIGRAQSAGYPVGFAGDQSVSWCAESNGYSCTAEVQVGGYVAELVLNYDGTFTSTMAEDTLSYLAEIADRMAGWPAPGSAWTPPARALAWDPDCASGVGSDEALVREVIPFDVRPAEPAGVEGGSMFWLRAVEASSYVHCVWSGPGGEVRVSILPGGAWLFDEGIALRGTPTAVPDALAAAVSVETFSAALSAYVRDSSVHVSVSPSVFGDTSIAEQVARDVMAVLVTQF